MTSGYDLCLSVFVRTICRAPISARSLRTANTVRMRCPYGSLSALVSKGQHWPAGGRDEIGQAAIEVGDAAANVDEQDDAGQRCPVAQIAAQDVGPFFLLAMGDRGIAIAGQVDQEAQLFAGCEGSGRPNMLISRVRPGVLLENARRRWLHSTLMAEDLPALERPTKQTSGAPAGGNWSRRAAEM